jgi:hypothetical protein
MKLSRYSPGIFPPGEREKEEGVDGGEGRLEVEEDCSIREGVEPLDPILVRDPSKPSPIEAADPGVGVASLRLQRDPMDSSTAEWNDCRLSPKKKGCAGGGEDE